MRVDPNELPAALGSLTHGGVVWEKLADVIIEPGSKSRFARHRWSDDGLHLDRECACIADRALRRGEYPVPIPIESTSTPPPDTGVPTVEPSTETPIPAESTATAIGASTLISGTAIITMKTSDRSAIPGGSTVCLAGVCMPLNTSVGMTANRAAFAAPDRSTTSVTFGGDTGTLRCSRSGCGGIP